MPGLEVKRGSLNVTLEGVSEPPRIPARRARHRFGVGRITRLTAYGFRCGIGEGRIQFSRARIAFSSKLPDHMPRFSARASTSSLR